MNGGPGSRQKIQERLDAGDLTPEEATTMAEIQMRPASSQSLRRVESGGKLNPRWVEWLMGWPLGWTDLKPLATAKFQQWLQQFGDC